MAAEVRVDVHYFAPHCLLGLFDAPAKHAHGFFKHCGYRMWVQSLW
jgi:hypothetical protein